MRSRGAVVVLRVLVVPLLDELWVLLVLVAGQAVAALDSSAR